MGKQHKIDAFDLGLTYTGKLEFDPFQVSIRNCIMDVVQARADKMKALIEHEFENVDWEHMIRLALREEVAKSARTEATVGVAEYLTSRWSNELRYNATCESISELKREISELKKQLAELKGETENGTSNLDTGTEQTEDDIPRTSA